MKKLILIIMVMILILTACGDNQNLIKSKKEEPKENHTVLSNVTYPESMGLYDFEKKENNPVKNETFDAINDFSYKTAKMLLNDTTVNHNYSPISLYYALAIASKGANGDTRQEILDLLGINNTEELQSECKNLYNLLYTDNEIGKLKIANSLWLQNNVDFKKDFCKSAAENFFASSHKVDFKNPETSKIMSDWIKESTNGVLNPQIEVNEAEILSIINTIYFYDEWDFGFDEEETATDIFHGIKGNETVDFLNNEAPSQPFYRGNGFTRSSLTLKNDNRMVFVLPDENKTTEEILNENDLKSLFEEGESSRYDVTWKIPKFSFGQSYKLIEMLNTLGVKKAFTENADFSNLTNIDAFISKVIQESHIAIDEKGVEAAAYTQMVMCGGGCPLDKKQMILDRPFIYEIIDNNNVPIFIGTVNCIENQ